MQVDGAFSVTAPHDVVRTLPREKIRQLGRLLAIIEQLVERDFENPRQFLQSFNGGHRVPVFDARNIAAQQTRAFFDVPLRELLVLAQLT